MRKIKYIVVHHSVTPRDLDINKSISSFNNNHSTRFPDMSESLGYKIAYHYIISGSGEVRQTRHENAIGYHASDWGVNESSIGICLTGNFDNETPSEKQMESLKKLIVEIKRNHDAVVIGHRDVKGVTKSCPGKNFTDKMIDDLDKINDVFVQAKEWAVKLGLCNDQNFEKPMKKEEVLLVLYRMDKLKK